MKPFTKTLVATLLSQSLFFSPVAMAKKDKSDDSDTKKEARKEQTADPQETRKSSRKNQPEPARKEQSKQSSALGPAHKKDRRIQPPSSKKPDKPSEPKKQTKDIPKNADVSRKLPDKPRKDIAPAPKQETRKDAAKDKVRTADRTEVGKNKNPKNPMPLPGKRPDVRKDSTRKTVDADGKSGKDRNAMPLPDKNSKRTADSKDKATNAKNKALALPGKRPAVKKTEQRAKIEQRQEENRTRISQRSRTPDAKRSNDRVRKQVVVRPGQNTRQIRRPNVEKNTNTWWTQNNRVTNTRVNRNNTYITNTSVVNRNFERNVNWTTGRSNWGYNPWWNRPQVRPWYGSSWNGSWNRGYYQDYYHHNHGYGYHPPGYVSVGTAIGWGLIGWSLGTLVYDTGYHSYHNPYPVRTQVIYRGSNFDYSQPITRVAVNTAPEDESAVAELTSKSESIIAESQTAFRQRNYLVALELADKAIAETPGDGALHEYRALVLFALGKYGDAAGVLNPVLASGPGWGWSTMIALYDSQQTYTDQLQKLEDYTEKMPDSADTHFLLGYHYMVCGHQDLATPQFDLAVELMPSDSVSKQLAELTRSSADPGDEEAAPAEATEPAEAPEVEPVPLEKLTGTWTSTREKGATITLTFKDDGKFTWSYSHEGKTTEFSGDYSMNDDGLLVLDSDESQMVANVELPEDRELKFVLAGGPPEDPGLDFTKG